MGKRRWKHDLKTTKEVLHRCATHAPFSGCHHSHALTSFVSERVSDRSCFIALAMKKSSGRKAPVDMNSICMQGIRPSVETIQRRDDVPTASTHLSHSTNEDTSQPSLPAWEVLPASTCRLCSTIIRSNDNTQASPSVLSISAVHAALKQQPGMRMWYRLLIHRIQMCLCT